MKGSQDETGLSHEGHAALRHPEVEAGPSNERHAAKRAPEDETNLSNEGRASLRHPEVKEQVCSLTEFQEWFQSLPEVVIDEVKYYVRGGDMLKDTDEVLWEWARKNRPDLIPPEEE